MLRKIFLSESAQSMAEYALIAALIGVAAITVLTGVGQNIVNKFTQIKTALQ